MEIGEKTGVLSPDGDKQLPPRRLFSHMQIMGVTSSTRLLGIQTGWRVRAKREGTAE